MNPGSDPSPRQLLLFADALQAAGLTHWLEAGDSSWRVVSAEAELQGAPALVIWHLQDNPAPATLMLELERLRERWQPAPLLLLLPAGQRYPTSLLLRLPLQGLLEAPERQALQRCVATLLGGGRVIEIAPTGASPGDVVAPDGGEWGAASAPLGLGQWLLCSGLQQIDAELRVCLGLLDPPPEDLLPLLLLQGRVRELRMARRLLLWLWGPVSLAWSGPLEGAASGTPAGGAPTGDAPGSTAAIEGREPERRGVALSLRERTADGLWEVLRERLQQAAGAGPANRSGRLLALDGLHPDRRSDLLLALLEQFEQLRLRLRSDAASAESLPGRWRELQPVLREQALRHMAGSYVQLPCEGSLLPVAETLVRGSELDGEDPELPDPTPMLAPLVQARPLLVEGRLVAPDEPQAVLYLEMLLANWLVRSAELISAEVLAACAEWPELRRYLLRPELLSTRNLERLRNQLNAQQRWNSWFQRPVHLYESRRPLFRLEAGAIEVVDLTEPRDGELRRLGWPQQLVTLSLEARDALAPQLHNLVRKLGDLLVVVLTQVVGRAIGLVGRGIAQGMGRGLNRG